MPIWAALFAWVALGERFTRARIVALVLCVAGMTILIYPLCAERHPDRACCSRSRTGVSWAAGTVYVKWARIEGDPVAIAAWQLIVGTLSSSAICLPLVEGSLHLTQAQRDRRCSARSSPGWSDRGSPISSGSGSSAACRR